MGVRVADLSQLSLKELGVRNPLFVCLGYQSLHNFTKDKDDSKFAPQDNMYW